MSPELKQKQMALFKELLIKHRDHGDYMQFALDAFEEYLEALVPHIEVRDDSSHRYVIPEKDMNAFYVALDDPEMPYKEFRWDDCRGYLNSFYLFEEPTG